MSYTHCPISTSPPPMDFTVLHEIMRDHIRRGNHFAVLGILALTVVHEDPAFWQTCTYHDGIASAVIATCVGNDGVKTHPPQESRCQTEEIAPNLNQEFLTENELYLMLRRVCGKDPLLCRVIHQLEMDPVKENNTSNGSSKELDAAVSVPSAAMRVNLDEVFAVLQERFRSLDERRSQSQGTTIPPATIGPQALKRARESDVSEENLGVIATESAAVAPSKSRYLEPVDGVDGDGCSDALEVLAHIHALPGTTCALNSFDAVAGLVDDGEREGLESHSSRQQGLEPKGTSRNDIAPVGLRPKQRRHKFTPEEDEAILQGVARFAKGPGRFESILYAYRGVWHRDRTATQLHDHWRGTLRQRAVLQQGGYRGKNSIATRGGKSEME
ncbi:putative ttaggg binding factor [Trypanosoma cruzi]|nr:putative ttaggg binding factor [Trypanosoma cruzi]